MMGSYNDFLRWNDRRAKELADLELPRWRCGRCGRVLGRGEGDRKHGRWTLRCHRRCGAHYVVTYERGRAAEAAARAESRDLVLGVDL